MTAQAVSRSQAARAPLQAQRREAFSPSAATMNPGRPLERLHALSQPGISSAQ